jgi:tight adherence protein C
VSTYSLVPVTGALAVLAIWYALIAARAGGARRERARIDRFVRSAGGVGADSVGVVARLGNAIRTVGRPFGRGDPTAELRFGAAIVGAALAAAALPTLGFDVREVGLGALGGAFLGYAAPGIALGRRVGERRRQIARSFPPTLDMLALCADAGLGLDAAIGQVVRRWDNAVTAELRRVLVELQVGRDRREALRGMARRLGLPEVTRFANAIAQADSLGVPLARVLQDQAAEVRQSRRSKAEESARTAPVKMMFPMVLLIFPALFIVILGPAVPRLLQALSTGP